MIAVSGSDEAASPPSNEMRGGETTISYGMHQPQQTLPLRGSPPGTPQRPIASVLLRPELESRGLGHAKVATLLLKLVPESRGLRPA